MFRSTDTGGVSSPTVIQTPVVRSRLQSVVVLNSVVDGFHTQWAKVPRTPRRRGTALGRGHARHTGRTAAGNSRLTGLGTGQAEHERELRHSGWGPWTGTVT